MRAIQVTVYPMAVPGLCESIKDMVEPLGVSAQACYRRIFLKQGHLVQLQ